MGVILESWWHLNKTTTHGCLLFAHIAINSVLYSGLMPL